MFGIDDMLLGAVAGSILGFAGQKDTNNTNVQLSRETRDWQERMSNTAYQRAVGDLGKAGLNPMLAYSQGGASTPNMSAPTVGNAIGAGVASGSQAAQAIHAVESAKQAKETTLQIAAQTKKIESETLTNQLNSAIAAANLRKLQFEGDKTAADAEVSDVAGKSAHQEFGAKMKYGSFEQSEVTKRAQSELAQLVSLSTGHTFSADVARRRAESDVARFAVPVAKREATFADDAGTVPKYLRILIDILRGGASAKSIMR